jgi:hypothetical protein
LPRDVFRLTFIIIYDDKFEQTFWDILQKLSDLGIKIIQAKNFFHEGNIYKGFNGIFRYNDFDFEIQFHTSKSKSVKAAIHPKYEELRILNCDNPEKGRLIEECIEMSRAVRNYFFEVPPDKRNLLEHLGDEPQRAMMPRRNPNLCENPVGAKPVGEKMPGGKRRTKRRVKKRVKRQNKITKRQRLYRSRRNSFKKHSNK